MAEIREYVGPFGLSPFGRWFRRLNAEAAAKVTVALTRLAAGNRSNVKVLGDGVSEVKVHFGPGFRVYFGWQGRELILLLGGGSKQRQSRDIDEAKAAWRAHKVALRRERDERWH